MRKVVFNKAKEIVCFTMSVGGDCTGNCNRCPIRSDDIDFARWLLHEAEKFKQEKVKSKNGNRKNRTEPECIE